MGWEGLRRFHRTRRLRHASRPKQISLDRAGTEVRSRIVPSITTPFSRLGDAIWLMKRHRRRLGTWPNPIRPRTLNDWVMRQLILTPQPLHAQFSCKLGQRSYKAARIGEAASLPLLGEWQDTAALERDWGRLPNAFILKPTHASSWYRVVPDKSRADRAAILAEAIGWLTRSYYEASHEIGYRNLPRRLIAEPLLPAPEGFDTPREIQPHCFDGRIALATTRIRTADGRDCYGFLNSAGRRLSLQKPGRWPDPLPPPSPAVWERIQDLSARLSRGVDFVRCDFLMAGETVWASELTPCPMGGRQQFQPHVWMEWLGAVWAATQEHRAWPEPPK
jgi:hypothetical protein